MKDIKTIRKELEEIVKSEMIYDEETGKYYAVLLGALGERIDKYFIDNTVIDRKMGGAVKIKGKNWAILYPIYKNGIPKDFVKINFRESDKRGYLHMLEDIEEYEGTDEFDKYFTDLYITRR